MDRAQAAATIAGLFEDGGHSVLVEGGGALNWEEALVPMPEAIFSVKSPTTGVTMLTLARDLWSQADQLQMATAVTRGLLAWHQEHSGEQHPDVFAELGALGALALRAGRQEHAGRLLEQAYSGLRSAVGGRDLRLSIVSGNFGLHLAQTGDFERAQVVLTQAYKIRKRLQPEGVATVAGQLGEVRMRLGMYEEGLECLRDAWLAHLDRFGAEHGVTLHAALALAKSLNVTHKHREAVPIWRDLFVAAEASGNAESIADVSFALGIALYRSRRKEEGIRRIDDVVRWTRAASEGEVHPELPGRLTFQAELQIDADRAYEAEGLLREAAEAQSRLTGDASVETAERYVTLGNLLGQLGRVDEGLGYLESACSVLIHGLGSDHPTTSRALTAATQGFGRAIDAAAKRGDLKMATDLYHHASGLAGPVLGFDHPEMMGLRHKAAEHRLKIG